MGIWIIDEADDFEDPIILNCCDYSYYGKETFPPWDIDDLDIWE